VWKSAAAAAAARVVFYPSHSVRNAVCVREWRRIIHLLDLSPTSLGLIFFHCSLKRLPKVPRDFISGRCRAHGNISYPFVLCSSSHP
jgi:hypothetical protein